MENRTRDREASNLLFIETWKQNAKPTRKLLKHIPTAETCKSWKTLLQSTYKIHHRLKNWLCAVVTIRSGRLPDLSVKITLTAVAGICKKECIRGLTYVSGRILYPLKVELLKYLDNRHWYSPNAAWKAYHKPEVIVISSSFVNIIISQMQQFLKLLIYQLVKI